jgi:hypothetical protein
MSLQELQKGSVCWAIVSAEGEIGQPENHFREKEKRERVGHQAIISPRTNGAPTQKRGEPRLPLFCSCARHATLGEQGNRLNGFMWSE